MAQTLKQSLTLTGGTGVTLSNSGVTFDASSPITQIVDIGQNIDTTDNVQFNAVTSSGYDLDGYTLLADRWTTNFTAVGNLNISGNITIPGNVTVGGKVIAEEIIAELTSSNTIFKSGSTQFGDTIDDTHYMTGSVYQSGSFSLLGYTLNEISNDVTLTDGSSTSLATESASKAYIVTEIGTVGDPTDIDKYLRKSYNKTATSVSNNTASFNSVISASAGSLTTTSEADYLFFNNGQVMEHDALQIQQSRGTFYLIADSDSLGYNLSSDDEIRALGKFESSGYLKFDGTDDEVTTTFSGSSGQGTNVPVPKTYSFWAKSSETARNQSPFGWGTNKKAFTFNFHAGRVLRWYNSNWYIYWDDTSAQDDGKWHHWMVYDSPSELLGSKLYVDGTLIPINEIISSSEAGAANYNQPLTIGSYRNDGLAAGAHFSGSIKEFSVFPGDKTSNASKYYNNGTPYDVSNEDELQAYWKISESSGSIAYDYSGNGNNGTLDGATWNS